MRRFSFYVMLLALCMSLFVSGTSCTSLDPTVKADEAQLATLDQQIKDMKAKVAAAATQPAQPGAPDYSAALAQLLAQQKQLLDKLASDKAAATANQVQQGGAAVTAVSSAIPGPWGGVLALLAPVITAGLMAWLHKSQANAASTDQAQTLQTTSQNNAATMQTAISALANSVPAPPPIALVPPSPPAPKTP